MSGPVAREIEILLQEAFLPTRLDVINDSARHHGHECSGFAHDHQLPIAVSPLPPVPVTGDPAIALTT